MDILESMEVRWFFADDDKNVVELEAWFQNVPVEDDDRRDYYYLDPQRPDLNAKERTGGTKAPKLEFKYRVGALGITYLAPSLVGQLERWTKLSMAVPAGAISSNPLSVEVKKARRLRKFSFDAGGISEVAAKDRPDAGCGVELTRVEAIRAGRTHRAYTFGLEAFGPRPVILEALQGTVRKLVAERPELRLDAAQSMNYSSWLIHGFPDGRWTHQTAEETPYYEHPAQGRPPSGLIPRGTLCVVVSEAGSHVYIETSRGT